MKVLAYLAIVAAVSAKGSGPYLPSGWKPDGPAFYLPSEIVKPLASSSPVTELVLDGSEASGSDSIREYGPPAVPAQNVEEKQSENSASDLAGSEASGSDTLREYGPPVLSQNIINQGLPDAVTEQNFSVELNFAVPEATSEVSVDQEVIPESVDQTTSAAIVELPTVEEKEIVDSQVIVESAEVNSEVTPFENVLTEANVESSDLSEAVAQTTESASQEVSTSESAAESASEEVFNSGAVAESTSQELSASGSVVESASQEVSTSEVAEYANQEVPATGSVAESSVQNIPEIIATLENEIPSQQVEINEAVSEVNSGLPLSGSLEQAPEGFLEYGPPGFAEYGPPKGDLVQEGELDNLQSVGSNVARRRRFSPKFRPSKKH